MDLEKLIKLYFHQNCSYQEILDFLLKKHNIKISLSTLKRILSELELKRKNFEESNLKDIGFAVVEELLSCGYNLGYRALWKKLQNKYGLKVKRDTVYRILKIADPEGVAGRYGNKLKRRVYLSPGPNFLWHLDGYDKLKPYGFAIHGCIDGFSRYVIWLEVATTNNNPKVTANYFLQAVKRLKFLPTIIRCDKGTENVLIGNLQTCLRKQHNDEFSGDCSFIQGKSIRNQRIESFWGRMRNHSMDFYIQFFKVMQTKNLFDGSAIDVKCLQYCFGPLIKYDLTTCQTLWNEHRIRKQCIRNNLHGKPFVLFNLPENYGSKDYSKNVDVTVVQSLIEKLTTDPLLTDPLFDDLMKLLLPKIDVPSSAEEALVLYRNILDILKEYSNK